MLYKQVSEGSPAAASEEEAEETAEPSEMTR